MLRVCPLPRESVRVTLAMGKHIIDELGEAERPELMAEGQNRTTIATPYTKIDERVIGKLCSMFDVVTENVGGTTGMDDGSESEGIIKKGEVEKKWLKE